MNSRWCGPARIGNGTFFENFEVVILAFAAFVSVIFEHVRLIGVIHYCCLAVARKIVQSN